MTTKRNNVAWLESRGAARVEFGWQGYDPVLNRPPDPGEADPTLAGRVLHVGSWEPERARTVELLANAGLPISVLSSWPQWASSVARAPSLDWRRWQAYGRAYSVALGSAAVALGVLRKQAEDQHTQRSLEIPATGTVLLAERTEEHRALFEEGVEAEFYASDEECVEKARRLLADEGSRRRMAAAGRRRCLESGYSWNDRMRAVLEAAGIAHPP